MPPDADSPLVGSLDMRDERDRGLLRTAIADPKQSHRRRWDVDDELKAQGIKALRVALRMALEKQDHRAVNGCVKTLAMLEGQNQTDEHLRDKYDRIDRGQATDAISQPNLKIIQGIDESKL